ncbi:unnamed protein product [Laminaria digitata]
MHSIFPDWGRYTVGSGVAATCFAAVVFSKQERAGAMTESTRSLETIVLDTATVTYKPSLIERVVGGCGVDLGEDMGCDVLAKKYGVRVSDCWTVDDVIDSIESEAASHIIHIDNLQIAWQQNLYHRPTPGQIDSVQRKIAVLEDLKTRMKGLLANDCPICLEPVKDLTFF